MTGDIWEIIAGIIASVGAAGAIILGLSSWLGKVWADRLAEKERAAHARELEAFRQQLGALAHSQQDLMVRQRAVYARIATTMRVFLAGGQNTPEARSNFLAAYDEGCVWASEPVIQAIGTFLDLLQGHTASPGSVPAHELSAAYGRCMTEMRRDAGFAGTTFQYRLVNF